MTKTQELIWSRIIDIRKMGPYSEPSIILMNFDCYTMTRETSKPGEGAYIHKCYQQHAKHDTLFGIELQMCPDQEEDWRVF